ncbi:MAG: hypothetical protein AAB518_03140 [Patescibacteria group bacterium]
MTRLERFSVLVAVVFLVLVFLTVSGFGRDFMNYIGLSLFAPPPPARLQIACGINILNEPYLTNPTHNQVTLSLRLGKPGIMWAETSTDGVTWSGTPQQTIPRDQRADFILSLSPNTAYQYRVACVNSDTGTPEYWFQNSFRSLPSPGAPTAFRFAYLTDTHYFQQYAKAYNGDASGIENVQQTVANILSWNPMFVIFGGDRMMPHCLNCQNSSVDGESAGVNTAKTVRQAELRNRQTIREFQDLLARVPGVFYNGNHEGENGFMQNIGVAKCGYRLDTDDVSEAARLKYLPSAALTYPGGDSTGNYYSFEVGLAQFTIIDVMKYQSTLPSVPHAWNLGAAQGNWFGNILASSNAPRKFVFAEHLVGGGAGGPPDCNGEYWYGRGQLKSKPSGTILGPFLGQQEELNQAMQQAGGAIWFSGHDHEALFGTDFDIDGDPTGNYYILGGRGGDHSPSWASDPGVISQYDYNENGIADYDETVDHASNKGGFWLVDVQQNGNTMFQYIATNTTNGDENNQPVITKIIQ